MVYTIRFVSDESDDFLREIKIDSEASFLDLRNALCDAAGYDRGQMHSVFICDDGWEKGQEITLEDMGTDSSQDVYLMQDTRLEEFLDDEGQRLIFVFDYLTDRSFFGEVKVVSPGQSLDTPQVSRSRGTAPAEAVDLEEFDAKIDAKAASEAYFGDEDDEFGGMGYNDDEIDPDLYTDSVL